MQTQEATTVAIIAAAIAWIVCHGLTCFATHKIVKSSLEGTDSADRAQILSEVPTVLRHLALHRWRRK
ncbi:hypothetical protein ABZZ80_31640 [Streptomyces sp. NPDC006356]